MAIYYFHLREGDKVAIDDQGVDLPDLAAAKREAELSARDLLADAIRTGKDRVPEAFVIADEHGRTLETFLFTAVLPIPFRT